MVNKVEKMLDDVNYKKEIKKPKEIKSIKTKVSKNNPSVNKNSYLDGEFYDGK